MALRKLELKISFGLNFTRLSNVYIKYCTCIQCGSFAKFYGRKYVVKDEIAKLKGAKINGIYSSWLGLMTSELKGLTKKSTQGENFLFLCNKFISSCVIMCIDFVAVTCIIMYCIL